MGYRGYSTSGGTPSFKGLKEDGRAVVNWALNEQTIFNSKKIVIHGNSLGASVGLHTLSHYALSAKIKAIIVENTFTSIGEMADMIYPKLKIFRRFILRNNWDNRSYIMKLPKHLQIYFSTGKKDEITPSHMIKELHDICTISNKNYVEYADGKHNNTWYVHKKEYFTNLEKFYKQLFH